jgi:hypothetical protein
MISEDDLKSVIPDASCHDNDMAKVGKMEKTHQEVGLQRQPSGIFEKHRWEMVGI